MFFSGREMPKEEFEGKYLELITGTMEGTRKNVPVVRF
jgi:hypothetical protein